MIFGKVLEINFKFGLIVEVVDVVDYNYIYLYKDEDFWYFMYLEIFE